MNSYFHCSTVFIFAAYQFYIFQMRSNLMLEFYMTVEYVYVLPCISFLKNLYIGNTNIEP